MQAAGEPLRKFKKKNELGCGIEISLSPTKTVPILVFVVLCLTVLSVSSQLLQHNFDLGRVFAGLVRLVDVDEEHNIPTWYQSLTLFFCSVLLAKIATEKKLNNMKYVLHWWGLSIIFLFLSIDEMVCIHERTIYGGGKGFSHFQWVIPAAFFVLFFALSYLKFLLHLPARTKSLIVLAAVLYVGGALGMELVNGYYFELYGPENIRYSMLTTLEEFLEMLGVVIFVKALLSHICSDMSSGHVSRTM